MGERQLRSRSMAMGAEAAPRDTESCHDSRELVCNVAEFETPVNEGSNAQIEVRIDGEEEQSPDNQVNNPEKSDDNIAMFSKQLERFMESVKEGFDNLRSEIHSNNTKLAENLNAKIQAENSRLVEQIEINNKRLSETLTKQFREENEKLRAELSNKLEGEVTKFQKAMDKLRSDTAIEILSVSNSMEVVCEKLDDRLTGHIEETDRRVDRISEELKAKTKILEIDLGRHVENTDRDVESIRQELIQVKQQINTDVSDKIAVCNSQIVAEKQEYHSKFLKVNQEIDKLKERLSVNLTGDKTINNCNDNNGCPTITLANECNREGSVSVVSTSNQASDQRSMNVSRACENVCKCGNTVQGEVNNVKVSENHVNVNPGLLAGCSSLNELTLPIYSDHTTQVIGNFLKDLDLYFDLKGVAESLKLPLAARAVQDPFTKAWLSAEYYKLGTYENFRTQVTQLLWNDQKQSSIRCKIFQDKFDRNGEETLAAHYLRYVNLAANLHPPLSEYDLLGALTAHYPYEVQKCMISANLKSNQEALTLLGKLQAMDEERKAHKENGLETKQRDFRKRENKQAGNSREDNRREYNQTVRHITYDRRQVNHPRSPYNRRTTQSHLGQNYNVRTGDSPTNSRQLNPQVSEFHPTARSSRSESNSEPVNMTGNELRLLEN